MDPAAVLPHYGVAGIIAMVLPLLLMMIIIIIVTTIIIIIVMRCENKAEPCVGNGSIPRVQDEEVGEDILDRGQIEGALYRGAE